MTPDINTMLSSQAALGSYGGFSDFLKNNNTLIPVLALLLLAGPARSFLRMGMGFLPFLAIAMLGLGKTPSINDNSILEGGEAAGQALSGEGYFSYITQQGWLMPALFICLIVMFTRGALFSLSGILPLLAVIYLLGTRDYSVESALGGEQMVQGFVVAGVIALLMWLRRRYVMAAYYGRPMPFSLATDSMLKMAGQLALVAAVAFAGLLLFNPAFIEESFPGWRSTWGAAALCAAGYGFMTSLPQRFRQWTMPAFWALVLVAIGFGLYKRDFLDAPKPRSSVAAPAGMEAF